MDLASALAAISALTQNVNGIMNRTPTNARNGQNGQAGRAGQPGQNPKPKTGNWVLVSQPLNKVRIYHTNEDGSKDTSMWIDVMRPASTTMRNTVTNEVLVIPGIKGNQ
jgi:hypothetical protein